MRSKSQGIPPLKFPWEINAQNHVRVARQACHARLSSVNQSAEAYAAERP